MFCIMPGPSVAHSGAPVPRTGSPTFRPAVSSYTWMVVFSEVMPMTSPMSPTSPTYTISIMEKPRAPRRVTTGPLIE